MDAGAQDRPLLSDVEPEETASADSPADAADDTKVEETVKTDEEKGEVVTEDNGRGEADKAAAAGLGILFCCMLPMYGGLGIACLVIGIKDRNDNPDPTCGIDAKPPLRDWIIGNGVICMCLLGAIGTLFFKACTGRLADSPMQKCVTCLTTCILCVSSLMCVVWAIVGAVSLANSSDCKDVDSQLWKLGLASVILMFLGSCGCSGTKQTTLAVSK